MNVYVRNVSVLFLTLIILVCMPRQGWAVDAPGWQAIQQAKDYRDAGKLRAAVIELKNTLQQNPENIEARLLLGQTYLQMHKGPQAEKELRRARQLGLDRSAVAVPLAEAYLLQGKFFELLEQTTIADGFSDDIMAEIYALRGEAQLAKGDLDEATGTLQQSLNLRPKLSRALLAQTRLAMVEGDRKTATDNVAQVLARDSKNVTAWSLSGDLAQSQGDFAEAEVAYSQAMDNSYEHSLVQLKRALVRIELDDYAGAAADVEALKKIVSDHPSVNYVDGLLSFRQRDAAKAQVAFDRVLNQQPRNLLAMFYLGASNFQLGRLEQAEYYLERYVTARPSADRARILLGMTRLQTGDFEAVETVLRPALASRPDDPLVLKTLGQALVAQGKGKEGNEYLARAVVLQPGSAGDRVDLAISLLQLGQEAAGIKELETAINLNPDMRQADILLVREYLQAGEFDQALLATERLQAKWPDSPAPLILKGMAYAGKGLAEKTRAAFEQALKIQPGEPSAAANLAALALNEGDAEKARIYFQQVLKHHPGHLQTLLKLARMESQLGNELESRARMDEAIRANPEALQPRILLARVQLGEGKPLNALTTLRGAQGKYSDNPVFLVVLGEAQVATGEAASAVISFRKLTELRPQSAQAYYLLANAYAASKNQSGLREALFKGLTLQPEHPLAGSVMALYAASASTPPEVAKRIDELKQILPDHSEVAKLEGDLALRQSEYGRAIKIFSGLLERFPEDGMSTLKLAQAYWQAGDQEKHLNTLRYRLTQQPQDVAAQFMLANSYLQLQRNTDARSAFSKILELRPNNILALNNLAWLLREDNSEQALVYAEKANSLNPGDPLVMDTMGVILLQQGKAKRAAEVLSEAAKKRPDMLSIRYHLAQAQTQQGDRLQAEKELRRILKDGRKFSGRQAAQALLAELEK